VATGDYANALHRYEETATLLRRLGDDRRVAQVIANMGSVASIQRDFERARTLFEEALELQQASGNRESGAISLHNLGRIELALDRLDEAGAWFEKALQDARELGYREIIAYCLEAFGELALARRDLQSAARLMGAAGALFDELGLALAPEEAETYGRALALLREQLGADDLDAERAAGAAEPIEDAMALALGVATRRVQRQ
jgi:tetratricopeptide (TPR) repeat protein